MKVRKHTDFMIDFISDFDDGKMSRFDFELDYSSYEPVELNYIA